MATKNTSVPDFEVSVHADFSLFLKRTETFLLRNEAMNNLLWEVGHALDGTGRECAWFGTVERAGKVNLAAVRGSTRYLILACGEEDAVKALAEFLAEKEVRLQGATGPVDEVDAFAEAWAKASGKPLGRGRSLKIYEIAPQNDFVNAPETPGRMRPAEDADRKLVRDWAISFAAESPSPMDPSTLVELAEAIRAKGNLFLWEDGEPVSMAGFGRSTPNGLVVNMVYTPGKRRRLGYAGALMVGLMVEARQRGAKLCCLFSEYRGERNLYERIGFREGGVLGEQAFSS